MEQLTSGQLQALLRTPECKKLLELLQNSSGAVLQQAAEAAKRGDYAYAQQLLKPALGNKETEALAKQLQNRLG